MPAKKPRPKSSDAYPEAEQPDGGESGIRLFELPEIPPDQELAARPEPSLEQQWRHAMFLLNDGGPEKDERIRTRREMMFPVRFEM